MRRGKRITIKDIAQHLGISHATVSRALADSPKARVKLATRQKVREVASALEYHPDLLARAVITRKTGILGLLTFKIFEPIYTSYIQNIMIEAHRHGYQIMLGLATSHRSNDLLDDQQMHIRQMMSFGVDGLLIHTRGSAGESSLIANAVRDAVPVVTFSDPVEGISSVVLDRFAGAYMAVEHLIRLGHQRIGFVKANWSPETAWQGYFSAMQEHGLTLERVTLDDTTLEAGYQIGMELGGASDRPTALICWGDLPAIGICRGLQEVGVRVPEEVAVVGFDGLDIGAYYPPPLTTVAQPVEDICQKVIQLLIDQLNGENEVKQVMVRPHLIVRRSCGADKTRGGGIKKLGEQ